MKGSRRRASKDRVVQRTIWGHPICSTAERALRALERLKRLEEMRGRVRSRIKAAG